MALCSPLIPLRHTSQNLSGKGVYTNLSLSITSNFNFSISFDIYDSSDTKRIRILEIV